jgi:polyhydroxyalkanoate synthesis regulator phasin
MAETDPDNRLVTRGTLKGVLLRVGRAVRQEVADPLERRLEALERRIAALEDKPS